MHVASHLALVRAEQGLLTDSGEAWPARAAGGTRTASFMPLRPATLKATALHLGSWGSFELNRLSSGSGRRAETSGKGARKADVHPAERPPLDGGCEKAGGAPLRLDTNSDPPGFNSTHLRRMNNTRDGR